MKKILMALKYIIKRKWLKGITIQIFLLFIILSNNNCALKLGVYYEVKKGENLKEIADRYNLSLKAIYRTNDKKVLENLKEGSKIFLPGVRKLKDEIKSNEKVEIVKKREEIKSEQKDKNNKEKKEIKKREEKKESEIKISNKNIEFIKPAEGKIVGYFGIRKDYINRGIDIELEKDKNEIRAAEEGKVIFCGSIDNYGKVIFIKHKYDYITVYANNVEIYVKEDEYVPKGKIISRAGYHPKYNKIILHFEIRKLGENNKVEILDPLNFLKDYK